MPQKTKVGNGLKSVVPKKKSRAELPMVESAVAVETQNGIIIGVLMICAVALLVTFGSSLMAGIIKLTAPNSSDYFLIKEAEHFLIDGRTSIINNEEGSYVEMSGRDGVINLNTKITLSEIALKRGNYNLWVKVIANATNRDSFMYKLPGQKKFTQHTIRTTEHSPNWQWRKISFSVGTNVNDNLILAWRETKHFDKVIITNRLDFNPNENNYQGRILIGHWKFDQPIAYSDTYYADSSGLNNHAVNVNQVYCETHYGIYGNSCVFGNFNQYLNISIVDKYFNPQSGTISAWINPSENRNNSYVIQGVGKNANRYYIQWTNGRLRAVRGSDAATIILASNVKLNNWYHVAISWDESTLHGYFNGQQVGSVKYNTTGTPPYYTAYKDTPRFRIGNQSHPTDNRTFPGLIDEVRFFAEKISNNDIFKIYNEDKNNTCFDSDNGDIFTMGMTYGFLGEVYKVVEDVCVNNSSSTLAEYSCGLDGQIRQEFIECENGCYEGACVKSSANNILIEKKPLSQNPNTELFNGNNKIAKFNIVPKDHYHSVSWKKINFRYYLKHPSNINISNCILINEATGFKIPSNITISQRGDISLETQEENYLYSMASYGLYCDISNVVSGDALYVNIAGDYISSINATNYLGVINEGEERFIWSDMSAYPHDLDSLDWYGSGNINILGQDWALSS